MCHMISQWVWGFGWLVLRIANSLNWAVCQARKMQYSWCRELKRKRVVCSSQQCQEHSIMQGTLTDSAVTKSYLGQVSGRVPLYTV